MNRKKGIAAVIIVIMLIAIIVALYYGLKIGVNQNSTNPPSPISTQSAQTPSPTSGSSLPTNSLNIGDTFTYKLTGSSVLGDPTVVTPAYLSEYNNTDYYKVTITGINGNQVSLNALWRFTNGTQVTSSQTIDLSNGIVSDPNGFWAIYIPNLTINDLLHPNGNDKLIVNRTDTQTFASTTRTRNFWATANQFIDPSDQTGNTMREDYMGVYFDKRTGMLESLTNIQFFTNPEIQITINWQLIGSNVWVVQ